jgi:hypothetical protein
MDAQCSSERQDLQCTARADEPAHRNRIKAHGAVVVFFFRARASEARQIT